MKLLHVFSTLAVGGAQTRFVQLVGALPAGYRHLVLAMDHDYAAVEQLALNGTVEKIDLAYDKKQTLRSLLLFRRAISRIRPDLLVTYNWGAIEWGLVNLPLPICPHMTVLDGFGPEEATASLPRRVRLRRLVYGRAAAVVVPSRKLETLAVNGWTLPAKLVRYLPNGIDTDRFGHPPDTAALDQFGLRGQTQLIGTLAALRPEKNLVRLLDAFHATSGMFPNARLVIIGEGPERAKLEQHAAALGIAERVHLIGNMANPERILGALSIYALSSDTEQMPISLIEAMAAGLPVASVDVGDVTQMVSPENRPFVQGTDAAALGASLARLLAAPAHGMSLGAANRAIARERFEKRTMVAAYDRLFHEAIGSTPAGRTQT